MSIVALIDDNTDSQDIYSSLLKEEGFTVLQAFDGKTGFQLIKDKNPDLVILDIMLPGKMNGFDFMEMMKQDAKLKNTPVIVLTNLDTEEQVAKNIGAKEYLIKSNMKMEDFLELVKKHAKKKGLFG